MRRKYEPVLHGWDDEKVYFVDETGQEQCVSDHPDLMVHLIEICRAYFAQKDHGPAAESGIVARQ